MNSPSPATDVRALLPALLDELGQAQDVLIGTHVGPDGDALGSAVALSFFLDARGIPNEVLCASVPPEYLLFMPGCDRVKQEPERTGHDLAVLVDLDALNRLSTVRPFFESCKRTVLIDHHVPHESPGDLRIVDSHSPATASILTNLLLEVEGAVTREVATCLLVGILTDTGGFRYRNTTPEALKQAAVLVEKGANIVEVAEEVYQTKELAAVKLQAAAIDRMQLAENGRLAWSTLPLEVFAETGALEEHNEGIVNDILSVRTVRVAALIREAKPGKVRASLRSRAGFDVAAVARQFGGGGHKNAAGASFSGTIDEAEAQLVEALRKCLASS